MGSVTPKTDTVVFKFWYTLIQISLPLVLTLPACNGAVNPFRAKHALKIELPIHILTQ